MTQGRRDGGGSAGRSGSSAGRAGSSGGSGGRPRSAGRPAGAGKPATGRPTSGKPATGRPTAGKPATGRPSSGKPATGRPTSGRATSGRPNAAQPEPSTSDQSQPAPRPARAAGPRGGTKGTGRPSTSGSRTTSWAAKRPVRRQAPVPSVSVDVHDPDGVRLQKILAQAGVGSRRKSEILIDAGRVQVDGHVVRDQGVRIDPARQVVHVDGVRLQLDDTRLYLAFNKPAGVVSTMSDEQGRVSLGDFVYDRPERLFHVGRLDSETEGLILLTNDGELGHRLQHPSYRVQKTYLAEISGPVARDVGQRLRDGVELEDGPVKVDSFKVIDSQPGKALVELVLHEGRKHIVRRALEAVGHPVDRLVRVQVGPLRLGDLRQGRWRVLNSQEVGALFGAVDM